MRLKYLKQYTESRKKQAEQIEKLSTELANQRIQLDERKIDKEKVLVEEKTEKEKLEAMRKEKQVWSIRYPKKNGISKNKLLLPKNNKSS
jgi:septal ring factor EnvC (AmiA/AmiB activator)